MKLRFLFFYIACFTVFLSCKDDPKKTSGLKPDGPIPSILPLRHSIVGRLPHDVNAFTEGLLFKDGVLYESTGSPEDLPQTRSVVGSIDQKTGKIDVKVELDRTKFFGEGIVFLKDKLYQLTYKNQMCFIYDASSFKSVGSYKYANAEGWGMTTDGTSLIMSDGTDKITYWDPATMKTTKVLNVKANGKPQIYLNELEYINGYIYANIWTSAEIAKIDPATGHIVGALSLNDVLADAKAKNPNIAEMNGIAFNPVNNQIYVTGKFWPHIYQIDFPH